MKYTDPNGREDDFCLCNNDFDFSTAMNVVGTGLTVLGLFLDFGAPLIAAALAGATGGTGAVAAPLVIAGCQAAGEALALAGATVLASNSALSYASNVHLSSNVKNQSKTSGKGSNSSNRISDKATEKLRKKFGSKGEKAFNKALEKGEVGPIGESGIKKLTGKTYKGKYTHELKVLNKEYGDYRIFGYKDAEGNFIFDLFEKGLH